MPIKKSFAGFAIRFRFILGAQYPCRAELLESRRIDMSSPDKSLLSYAEIGNLDKVRKLLRSAANFDPKDRVVGDTALSLTSAYGHADVVRNLLKHDKVDVNEATELEERP